jgi:hypothetical protein
MCLTENSTLECAASTCHVPAGTSVVVRVVVKAHLRSTKRTVSRAVCLAYPDSEIPCLRRYSVEPVATPRLRSSKTLRKTAFETAFFMIRTQEARQLATTSAGTPRSAGARLRRAGVAVARTRGIRGFQTAPVVCRLWQTSHARATG